MRDLGSRLLRLPTSLFKLVKLFVFVFFVAMMAGGLVRTDTRSGVPPKPALYGLLRPFPVWSLWMLLLMPLALFLLPLGVMTGLDIMGGSAWLLIIAGLTYFYLISCLIVAGWEWVKKGRRSRQES